MSVWPVNRDARVKLSFPEAGGPAGDSDWLAFSWLAFSCLA